LQPNRCAGVLEPFDDEALRNELDGSSSNEPILDAERQDLEYALALLDKSEATLSRLVERCKLSP
jgi:hypothetical protein